MNSWSLHGSWAGRDDRLAAHISAEPRLKAKVCRWPVPAIGDFKGLSGRADGLAIDLAILGLPSGAG
nr:hypothetical protein [Massilia cavernae]